MGASQSSGKFKAIQKGCPFYNAACQFICFIDFLSHFATRPLLGHRLKA
jgi:hypothetical protein